MYLMPRLGTQDRRDRFKRRNAGSSGTNSQDLLVLVGRLFVDSKALAAGSVTGNTSSYTYAGIPMLLAALRALVVEYEFMLNPSATAEPPDISSREFIQRYHVRGRLLQDFEDLLELRNEIIHPAHVMTGTPDNWPNYLRRVKELGLLNMTGAPDHDYGLFHQMASHRLFAWSIGIVRSLYEAVITSDPQRAPLFMPFLETFNAPWFKE